MFKPVATNLNLPALETQILDFWKAEKIFEKSLEKNKDGTPYIFFEGPPTANGRPGIHHVLARSFKDVYNRYKTMQGFHVARKAGWDTHGLPVEREVEKELGIINKEEILKKVGLEEFNRRCRDSVHRYVGDWNALTERMGFWIDLEDPYFTLDNKYIETVWWLLKQMWDKDLVFQAYKVVPYDPQVGATMSSHEVGLGYKDVEDPSVFVRMRCVDRERTSFLVWTTTPWTLPSNVAIAVHPDEDYVEAEVAGEILILASKLVGKIFPENPPKVIKTLKGKDLEGSRYVRLFDFLEMDGDGARVVCEDFVTMEDGTGIVHMAPAYGADDLAARQRHDLPILFAVLEDGKFIKESPWAGLFFKDADKPIMQDLESRGLMFRATTYAHSYPFGWRTDCPLIYFAKTAWYIRTTRFKDRLIELNNTINWVPEHVKSGRFGDWLSNNVDWALSRERFWGTPLPVWTDDEGNQICVGSIAELETLAGKSLTGIDLHRPYVDEITFPHPRTGKTMRRVEEVIDCWFDSGAMPYAQWHYPFENAEVFKGAFPADFISEAVDQTRGWFYTLHAIATLVSDSVAYKNCVCLGHVVDADGAKMSKSKGNILNPWEVFDAQGADALRWFFLVGTPPGSSKRVSVELVAESVHGTFNTLWNTYAFFVMYANLDQPDLIGSVHSDQLEPIDRWILSRLNQTNLDVTRAMDGYDVQEAGRLLASFVDELSNWYVRLNRRRFWKGEDDRSKLSAYWTLYMSLRGSISMLAPIAPFLAEHMYQNLVRPIDEEASASVHTEDWPCADRSLIDESLMAEMSVVLQAISLGRAARIKAQAKVRQPLASAVVVAEDPASRDAIIRQSALIKDELNVKEVRVLESSNELVEHALRPNLPRLGPRLGKKLGLFRKLLTTLDPAPVVAALRLGGTYDMDLDGESVSLTQDDLLIDAKPAAGFHSAEGEGLVVSLDTRLTRELGLEGIARDVIRLIQESRKKHGLDVSDRIHLRLESSEDVTEAIKVHGVTISRETLAVSLNAEDIDQKEVVDYHGTNIVIGIRLVTD